MYIGAVLVLFRIAIELEPIPQSLCDARPMVTLPAAEHFHFFWAGTEGRSAHI